MSLVNSATICNEYDINGWVFLIIMAKIKAEFKLDQLDYLMVVFFFKSWAASWQIYIQSL